MESVRNLVVVAGLCVALAGCGGDGGSTSGSTGSSTIPSVKGGKGAPSASAKIGGCVKPGKGIRAERFSSPDGRLKGALVGDGAVGVVFANESGNDLCQWQDFAESLPRARTTSALFSYSEVAAADEVRSVAAALRNAGARQVIAVGASLGGRAVVELAADRRSGVDRVVSLSGERIDASSDLLPFAKRARIPVLYVSSANDGLTTFAKDTRQLYAAGKHVRGTRLIIVGGDKHGTALLQLPRIRDAVLKVIDG